jgi:predicted phage terminase large subunit-like protein
MKALIDTLIARDFPSFCRICHQICRDGETLNDDPYLLLVFSMAEEIASGEVKKAGIAMPPGTAKSFIFAVCLPAWILAHQSSAAILVVAHSEKLANDSARNIKKILNSDMFKRSFKTRLDAHWDALGNFGTTVGGSVYAVALGGSITGFRADYIIVDDPLAIKHAKNERRNAFVIDTFDDEILSRRRDKSSRVVVVMHRLNPNDLINHIKGLGGYKMLLLPLIASRDKTYRHTYGAWHRKKNEQLRSNAYDKGELRDLAFKPIFRFLYQQGMAGGRSLRVKARHFSYFGGRINPALPIVYSIDAGQKAGNESSRSAIQVWQTDRQNHYLLHTFAESCDYQKLWKELVRLIQVYPPSVMLIEDASNGSALISQIEAMVDCEVRAISPKGSKSARFLPHFHTIRKGRIHVPVSAIWVNDFIEEICAFPESTYDDQVDCLSMFLAFMAERPKIIVRQSSKRTTASALASSNGRVTQFVPDPESATTRGYIGRPALSHMLYTPPSSMTGGRPSLSPVDSTLVKTRLGTVLVRGSSGS